MESFVKMKWKDVYVLRLHCHVCKKSLLEKKETFPQAVIVGIEHQVREKHERVSLTFSGEKDGKETKHTLFLSKNYLRRSKVRERNPTKKEEYRGLL